MRKKAKEDKALKRVGVIMTTLCLALGLCFSVSTSQAAQKVKI